MHPIVPMLACYALGLALLLAVGGGGGGAVTIALAFAVGAATWSLVVFGLDLVGVSVSAGGFTAVWCALLVAGGWRGRRELRRVWRAAAIGAAVLGLFCLLAARYDASVVRSGSHDLLLVAKVMAEGGSYPAGGPEVSRLLSSLHAAFFLYSSDHVSVLVAVLAASTVVGLAVVVATLAGHRRRVLVGLLAGLALASWFPLVRALVTVGSPAAAGLFLLAAGALWQMGELGGDRRPPWLSLVVLVGYALHGGWFALGAVGWLVVMVAGTRLTGRALGWRYGAAAAHPGLTLLAATSAAWLAAVVGGEGFAGLVAAAPTALFALVSLASASNPGHGLAAPAERPVTRSDLGRLAIASVAGGAIAAGLEWTLLVAQAGDRFTGTGQKARLLPLEVGNLLPYALLVAVLLLAVEVASRRLVGLLRRPRLVVAGSAAVLSLPYAIWLGRFTFSGPQARAMAFQPLLIGLASGLVALGFAAAIGLAALRASWRGRSAAVAVALVAGSGAMLVASRAGLENEYEPLHQFLAIWSLLLAVLAGREIAFRIDVEARRRLAPALALVALVWTIGAGAVLARAHGDAWLLWGETGASRYLTQRWSFLTPEPDPGRLSAGMIVKPDLESSATAALRAGRAAAPAPHIVLFSIDGLRQDRVGAYGYTRRRLTPNIDRLAARGVRFTRAFSSFPATQVFNSALLLGRALEQWRNVQQPPLYRPQAITNLLKTRDYHVFVKSWFDELLTDQFDAAPFQFDTYVPKTSDPSQLEEPMEAGLDRLAAHLDQARERSRPVFAWIHLLATHPIKGEGFRGHPQFDFGDAPEDRYESAVAGSDLWLGGIEQLMAARGGDRPTIWIVLADHGVNFHKRGRDLYEGVVRVPLVIVVPGATPRVDDRPIDVSLDLAATVVDLAGIAPPAEFDGVSLVPLLQGLPAPGLEQRLIPLRYLGSWTGAIHGRYKSLRRKHIMSLFDLAADPAEKRNLVGQQLERTLAMSMVADRELARRLASAEQARRGL